jgi:hypothetical protein
LTVNHVKWAREAFVEGEPRNLFYLVATELVDQVRNGTMARVSVAQALAVLLQTWNAQFYRFRGGFHKRNLSNLDDLLREHSTLLENYRSRQIISLAPAEEETVRDLFGSFEVELGGVGAASASTFSLPPFFHFGTGPSRKPITLKSTDTITSISYAWQRNSANHLKGRARRGPTF